MKIRKIFLFDPPIGKLFRPSIDPPTRVSTVTETVSESVTETEAQKNFNFLTREKEVTEKIIAIFNKNSGNTDDTLAEKIKEYIKEFL